MKLRHKEEYHKNEYPPTHISQLWKKSWVFVTSYRFLYFFFFLSLLWFLFVLVVRAGFFFLVLPVREPSDLFLLRHFEYERRSGLSVNLRWSTVSRNNQEYRLEHWATRLSIRSHRSCIRLFLTTGFARALRCAPLRSLAHSLARGKVNNSMTFFCVIFLFWTKV